MPACVRTADSAPSAPTTSAGAELAAVGERDADRVGRGLERREAGAQQHHAGGDRARGQRGLHRAVLGDVPEVGLAEFRGVEDQRAGPRGIHALFPDHHALVGRGAARDDRGPGAGALEQLLRGARQRGDAQVERRRRPPAAAAGFGSTSAMRSDAVFGSAASSAAAPAPAIAPPTITTSKSRFTGAAPAPGAAAGRPGPWCGARTRASPGASGRTPAAPPSAGP